MILPKNQAGVNHFLTNSWSDFSRFHRSPRQPEATSGWLVENCHRQSDSASLLSYSKSNRPAHNRSGNSNCQCNVPYFFASKRTVKSLGTPGGRPRGLQKLGGKAAIADENLLATTTSEPHDHSLCHPLLPPVENLLKVLLNFYTPERLLRR